VFDQNWKKKLGVKPLLLYVHFRVFCGRNC